MTANVLPGLADTISTSFARKRRVAFAIPAVILGYLKTHFSSER